MCIDGSCISSACVCCMIFFFVKQKTAYEMRISDWSSDVCSSDLVPSGEPALGEKRRVPISHSWLIGKSPGVLSLVTFFARAKKVTRPRVRVPAFIHEIGRASCRERVCQYV